MMEIRSHIIPYIQMWACPCGPAAGKVEYVLNYCTLGSARRAMSVKEAMHMIRIEGCPSMAGRVTCQSGSALLVDFRRVSFRLRRLGGRRVARFRSVMADATDVG